MEILRSRPRYTCEYCLTRFNETEAVQTILHYETQVDPPEYRLRCPKCASLFEAEIEKWPSQAYVDSFVETVFIKGLQQWTRGDYRINEFEHRLPWDDVMRGYNPVYMRGIPMPMPLTPHGERYFEEAIRKCWHHERSIT